MIQIDNVVVDGWLAAIRGMRNPMNSWELSDSKLIDHTYILGQNDRKLMQTLCQGGPVHAKFRRFITITMDITAPLYWWKEFDTYKVGTVANSCSTMHKIHAKEFTLDDFSCEHLTSEPVHVSWKDQDYTDSCVDALIDICGVLNAAREKFLETNDKKWWWQMIQLLPSSYNQKRTVLLNYEVASHIYPDRKNHKLDEWHDFCDALKALPYSQLITGKWGETEGAKEN